jgi:hypothetical protein
MMLPSVLMKRTTEKVKEHDNAGEDLADVLHSIHIGKLREAFNKVKNCQRIKRCLSSGANLYQKV